MNYKHKFACYNKTPEYLGTILSHPTRNLSAFPATVEQIADNNLRMWYSDITNDVFTIARAEGNLKRGFKPMRFRLNDRFVAKASVPTLGNLPKEWMPTQPVHIMLPSGGFRLYFWAHCYKQGIVRYLAADSDDGVVYNVVNAHSPCLYHYCDRAGNPRLPGISGLAGLRSKVKRPACEQMSPPELVCNDATTVYRLPDQSFEVYSAAIISVRKDSPEYIPWDNCPGKRRLIRRWTSVDGLHFIPSGTVLAPDENDHPWIQFYYLSVRHRPDGTRDGIIGLYDVLAQRMDFERCVSQDGIHWHRERKIWLDRKPGEVCVYAVGTPFISDGDHELLFYTAFNYTHNAKYRIGKKLKGDIRCVRFLT